MVQQRSTVWWSKPHDSDATLSPLNSANSTTVTELKIKTGHFGTQLHTAAKFTKSHHHAFRKCFCKKVWPLMYDCPLVVPVGSLVPSLSTVKMHKNKNKKTNVPVHSPSVGCNGITRQTYSQLIALACHSLITDINYLHVQSWGSCSHA